jgi:hypothetical protein
VRPVILIEKGSYHIRSDEVAKNVHDFREQCFERRAHGGRTMTLHAADDIQITAVGLDPPNIPPDGLIGLGALERSGEQRAVPVISNRLPETFGHTRAGSLHRCAERWPIGGPGRLAFEQVTSHLTRRG